MYGEETYEKHLQESQAASEKENALADNASDESTNVAVTEEEERPIVEDMDEIDPYEEEMYDEEMYGYDTYEDEYEYPRYKYDTYEDETYEDYMYGQYGEYEVSAEEEDMSEEATDESMADETSDTTEPIVEEVAEESTDMTADDVEEDAAEEATDSAAIDPMPSSTPASQISHQTERASGCHYVIAEVEDLYSYDVGCQEFNDEEQLYLQRSTLRFGNNTTIRQ